MKWTVLYPGSVGGVVGTWICEEIKLPLQWEWIVKRKDLEIRRVYFRRLELGPSSVVPTARELQGSAEVFPCFLGSWKCVLSQATSWVGLYIIHTVLSWLQCPLVSTGLSCSCAVYIIPHQHI